MRLVHGHNKGGTRIRFASLEQSFWPDKSDGGPVPIETAFRLRCVLATMTGHRVYDRLSVQEYSRMATPDQLRTMITARPFLPFLVKLGSGQSYVVKHPENASCDPRGRSMVVQDEDGIHLLEMVLIEVMEPAKSPGQTTTEGNGA